MRPASTRREPSYLGRGALAAVLGLLAASGLAAQSISRGSLSGIVRDSAGPIVTGALVTLVGPGGGGETVEADPDGRFGFGFLHPALYDVLVEQIGYRPVRVRRVRVHSEEETSIVVSLEHTSLPVSGIDTTTRTGSAARAAPGVSYYVPRLLFERFPSRGVEVAELAGLGVAEGPVASDGLTTWPTGMVVDGTPYPLARHPTLSAASQWSPSFPELAFDQVGLLNAPQDIEWMDVAGGLLTGISRRAPGGRHAVQLFGDGSGGPFTGSRFFDPQSLSHRSVRGGAVVGGPILGDTADYLVGVSAEWIQQPRPPAWAGGAADSALVAIARDSFGVDLADHLTVRRVESRQVSAFGRFGWRVAPNADVALWASAGRLDTDEPAGTPGAAPRIGTKVAGQDVTAGVTVTSRFGERVAQELRVSIVNSRREFSGSGMPATFFANGSSAGTDPVLPGSFEVAGARVSSVLHARTGAHRFKLGLGGEVLAHDQTYAFAGDGTYYFADQSGFAARRGAFYGLTRQAPVAHFTVPGLRGFLQDRWTVAPGLELVVGLRYDAQILPVGKVVFNQAWFDRTNLANNNLDRWVDLWSSRIGFDWRSGAGQAWRVLGGLGVYYDRVDPGVLGEVIAQDGRTAAVRSFGVLAGWPTQGAAPEAGAVLTLLSPRFVPARSTKGGLGVGRSVGANGLVDVSFAMRHTDFLLRRHDLNRLPGVAGQDQYGRPLYAGLQKEGGLVGPVPGTGRRFGAFELVSALDPDGYSDYWGVAVRLLMPLGSRLGAYASYTYSRTTDNALSGSSAGPYAVLTPFPDSLAGQDWATGTADLDVPHRLTAGLELAPFRSRLVTLAAQYRYRSGLPFTPGFRWGADVNGDGSGTNDPAFVDETLPGMAELMAGYDCLNAQARQFAARNSCQEPGTGSLDARLGLSPLAVGGLPVELWVEVFNLVEPEVAVRDHALYLIDPNASLVTNATTGRVTVPLTVNPTFGQPLSQQAARKWARIGLRLNY